MNLDSGSGLVSRPLDYVKGAGLASRPFDLFEGAGFTSEPFDLIDIADSGLTFFKLSYFTGSLGFAGAAFETAIDLLARLFPPTTVSSSSYLSTVY